MKKINNWFDKPLTGFPLTLFKGIMVVLISIMTYLICDIIDNKHKQRSKPKREIRTYYV